MLTVEFAAGLASLTFAEEYFGRVHTAGLATLTAAGFEFECRAADQVGHWKQWLEHQIGRHCRNQHPVNVNESMVTENDIMIGHLQRSKLKKKCSVQCIFFEDLFLEFCKKNHITKTHMNFLKKLNFH